MNGLFALLASWFHATSGFCLTHGMFFLNFAIMVTFIYCAYRALYCDGRKPFALWLTLVLFATIGLSACGGEDHYYYNSPPSGGTGSTNINSDIARDYYRNIDTGVNFYASSGGALAVGNDYSNQTYESYTFYDLVGANGQPIIPWTATIDSATLWVYINGMELTSSMLINVAGPNSTTTGVTISSGATGRQFAIDVSSQLRNALANRYFWVELSFWSPNIGILRLADQPGSNHPRLEINYH